MKQLTSSSKNQNKFKIENYKLLHTYINNKNLYNIINNKRFLRCENKNKIKI